MSSTPPAAYTTERTKPRLTFVSGSVLAMVVLILISWTYLIFGQSWPSHGFFSGETASRASSFLGDLAGVGRETTPAYLEGEAWAEAGRLALSTLAMSVLAAGIAAVGALFTFMFAARNVMAGELAPYRSPIWTAWLGIVRLSYALSRSVPELIWAMLLVFIFAPGILPGALALAIHNSGILLPRFITYLFYRWEVIIRTTIVVGLVAAGGLGMEFRIALSHFHYTTVTLLLIWYLLLVLGVDLVSAAMRRLAR